MRLAIFILALVFTLTAQAKPITAKSFLVTDNKGTVILEKNADRTQPIASITKLVTAMIVLDAKQNLDEKIAYRTFKSKRKQQGKKETVDKSHYLTRRELLYMSIVHSDNHAAGVLCNNYAGGTNDCISAMNFKVAKLGMMSTSMFDPTGLDQRNISTAEDLIKLVQAARGYPEIVHASKQTQVKIKLQKKWLVFNNTNPMIGKDHRIVVSKTGFTNPAGGCIVMGLDTEVGQRTIIVLGSKNTRTRIPEAEFISNIKQAN
jgi:D-alanyl-D-alanine carboxypeptidase